MLKIENLKRALRGHTCHKGISMEVPMGKIVTLIGANGVRKEQYPEICRRTGEEQDRKHLLEGKNLLGLLPEEILMSGVALCPEGRRIFPQLPSLKI